MWCVFGAWWVAGSESLSAAVWQWTKSNSTLSSETALRHFTHHAHHIYKQHTGIFHKVEPAAEQFCRWWSAFSCALKRLKHPPHHLRMHSVAGVFVNKHGESRTDSLCKEMEVTCTVVDFRFAQ